MDNTLNININTPLTLFTDNDSLQHERSYSLSFVQVLAEYIEVFSDKLCNTAEYFYEFYNFSLDDLFIIRQVIFFFSNLYVFLFCMIVIFRQILEF